jgi:hypothetical protein
MAPSRNHGRAGIAAVLAALLLGAVVGLSACGAGGEDPSARPSALSSVRPTDRPDSGEPDATRSREPERTTQPADTTRPAATTRPPTTATVASPEPTRTTRSATPAEATTRPPTSAAVVAPEPTRTTPTATPAGTTPTPAVSVTAAAAATESGTLGPFGWLLVILLLAALIVGGLLVYRSQRRSAWDTEARALESETRTAAAMRVPPVLRTTTTGQRALAWPPVRADLIDARSRWNALAQRASGEARRSWSLRISALLQDLIVAVEAENEALAVGQDWMRLRPRIDQAEQALAAVLATQPQPEPPGAGEPGPSALPT